MPAVELIWCCTGEDMGQALRLDCMRVEYVETSIQPVWMIGPDATSYITEPQKLPRAFV